jgi:hypothetical protein
MSSDLRTDGCVMIRDNGSSHVLPLVEALLDAGNELQGVDDTTAVGSHAA